MKTIFGALLVLVSATAIAQPQVEGRWQSDRELTMRFIRDRSRLEEKTLLFLGQMMGRLTLSFENGKLTSSMPNWEGVTVGGVKSEFVGYSETYPFQVVASTENQVAVVSQEPVGGSRRIAVYTFDGPNTICVYVGGPPFAELHLREYFVRVQ